MRRTFPRTSDSPQAPAIVETPAHYTPTLFCRLALLSEVMNGSVEPLCLVFLRNTVQIYEKTSNNERKRERNSSFGVILQRYYGIKGNRYGETKRKIRRNREEGTG